MSSLKALEIEFAFFYPLGNPDVVFLVWHGHKPAKHGNLERSGNFEKLSKFKWKLREIRIFVEKNMENSGKCKICDINVNKNVFQQTFLSRVTQGKFENTLEISGKIQGI